MNIKQEIKRCHAVGCPIVTYSTSDPAAAVQGFASTLDDCGVVVWDIAAGVRPAPSSDPEAGERNRQAVVGIVPDGLRPEDAVNLAELLIHAEQAAPEDTVLIVLNAHRHLDDATNMQAVWNARDSFKSKGCMLVLVGASVNVPLELTHDVIEMDEPLPGIEELSTIVRETAENAGLEVSDADVQQAAEACQGVSAFAAEQLIALSLRKSGIDTARVWEGKYRKINATPGLQVVSGEGGFDTIAGCDGIKKFLARIMQGKDSPNAVVFVDEIEKAIGGSQHDTSGVSQDQLGQLLEWMQDKRAAGLTMVGPPGAAKSAIAKAVGSEFGVPTIKLDLGGLKGSLVGQSEGRIREALKVIEAVSGAKTLWLATCNSLAVLPPELRRRFRFGTWFNDLPTQEERRAIWNLYVEKFELSANVASLDGHELTGAEIESACEMAWRMEVTPDEALDYVVPVAKAVPDKIESLRTAAAGTMIDAATGKPYSYAGAEKQARPTKRRRVAV